MAKIGRFEELKSWQKARQLANLIYQLTEQQNFSKDFRLRNQIRDAAGSTMHNIAEGFDAGSNPEFIRFLKIARRSASEVQSQLYLAIDRQYISLDELQMAYKCAEESKKLINGMIATCEDTRPKNIILTDTVDGNQKFGSLQNYLAIQQYNCYLGGSNYANRPT